MSRIDDLLAELCPDGVSRRALGELLDYEQPGKYLVSSTAYDDSLETPVLTAGKSFILGYTDEDTGIYAAYPDRPVVIFDDFTTAFRWVDFRFKAKSSAMKMLTPKRGVQVDFRYLYYAMQTIEYQPRDHARQWIGIYSNFTVPVPALDVQREVVKVLDTFTELEAELEARRRQYEHYRDSLLSFREAEDVRWLPMGEVGTFIRGKRFTKADYVVDGIPCIHYGEIYTEFGPHTDVVVSRVKPQLVSSLRFARPGDVVIVDVGETVDDVGKAVAWLGVGEVAIHDHCFAFRHGLDPAFVSYYMQTSRFRVEKAKHVGRTKVKTLLMGGLAKVLIPVPPPAEQARIVALLDMFDALVNDLSIGLPAELKARRQQYEYYRDKLLTFRELAT